MQTILNNTYRIIEEIGHGGGGTVCKAIHLRLNKYVVVKEIHGSVQAKRNEVDILKNLKNPYLPQVCDFVTVDEEVYTVMEFIDGRSFKQLLDQGIVFTQDQAAIYGGQLLEALDYLHSQRIPVIHGDVKTGNVMLTPEGAAEPGPDRIVREFGRKRTDRQHAECCEHRYVDYGDYEDYYYVNRIIKQVTKSEKVFTLNYSPRPGFPKPTGEIG